jgi:hypothetical protein
MDTIHNLTVLISVWHLEDLNTVLSQGRRCFNSQATQKYFEIDLALSVPKLIFKRNISNQYGKLLYMPLSPSMQIALQHLR